MNRFRHFAFLTTLATYFLIFVGGLVRVSGAGMGCPDWPRCFGRWIPPLHVSQIPPEIDPAIFNITLAWIEYGNRLVGVLVGILIVITAILAIKYYRKVGRILYSTIAAALLVAFQGWQGSQVVAAELEPFIVTVHMVLALIIASLLIYATQESYRIEHGGGRSDSHYPRKLRTWAGILWLASIVEVILGSQVREALANAAAQFPLWEGSQWFSQVGLVDDLHLILGGAITFLTIIVAGAVLKVSSQPSLIARQSARGLIAIVVAQMMVGVALMFTGLSPLLELFHLWLAAAYIGLILVLYASIRLERESLAERERRFVPIAVSVAAAVILMAGLAYGVVHQAEKSRSDISVVAAVPEFQYTERSGQPFGLEQMKGKINIIDFIFTRCRGACPTMCHEMSILYKFYKHSDRVQFVSITVDPDHDTLEVMRKFLSGYGVDDDRWLFLRTDIDSVKTLAREGFMVSDDFPGLHSTRFILVDPDGNIRGYYEHTQRDEIARLKEHIKALARIYP